MGYRELLYLKFKKKLSTFELVRRFPAQIERVSLVALMDIPEDTLRKVLPEERDYNRVMRLKRRFSEFL